MKSKIVSFLRKNKGTTHPEHLEAAENSFEKLHAEMEQSFPELKNTPSHSHNPFAKPHIPRSEKIKAEASSLRNVRFLSLGSIALAVFLAISTTDEINPMADFMTTIFPDTQQETTKLALSQAEATPTPITAHTEILEEGSVDQEKVDTVILGEIQSGDTLANIMTAAGVSQRDTYLASKSFGKVFSTRKLRPGQKTSIRLKEGNEGPVLQEFVLEPDQKRKIIATRLESGDYETVVDEVPLDKTLKVVSGVIDSSLYVAATDKGLPSNILADLINIYSYDVDFQREIQKNDGFSLMYESLQDAQGRELETGDIKIATMTLSGETYRYYRYKGKNKFADYYNEKGQSVRKALLRTPIDGARISSGFGKRRHPVLGYSKMHKGTDFAAPKGTPIYAAGDGVIEVAGWNGSFGKYVRIRHNNTYKTAYAHMNAIAKGVSKGKRVRQRQVIGYVGTTGRSTGNHLHFEVHKNNRQVNPLSVKLPTGKELSKKEMANFKKEVQKLEKRFKVAQAKQNETTKTTKTAENP